MKKFKSLIIALILLFSCFGLTAFAENSSITISDDYQNLYLNGDSYSRFNASILEIDYYMTIDNPIELSAVQQETILQIELLINEQENVISADISFTDGSILSVDFLREDCFEAYNEIVNGESKEYIIDFLWPEGNTVKAKRTALFDTPVTLYVNELEWCDFYTVTASNSDNSLTALKGSLLIMDDNYYYVDFAEVGVKNAYEFVPYDYTELSAYEITDTNLLQRIKEAEEKYYADDLGFLYDDDLTETISAVFLVFIFAIIPLAIFIVFLILAIRSKTYYRKLFRTICILAAAELAIFAIIATLIVSLK